MYQGAKLNAYGQTDMASYKNYVDEFFYSP